MKRLRARHLCTLLLPLVVGACRSERAAEAADASSPEAAAAATVDLRAEEQAIRTLSDQWTQAAIAGDAAAMANLYAEDGVMMEPDRPDPVRGRAAIRDHYQGMMQLQNRQIASTATHVEVARAGDLAYEAGDFSFAADGPQGRIEETGRYLAVWKKIDGRWQMVSEMSQSSRPAAGRQQ